MTQTKINYDRDADVLYVSFGRSQHVTGVELIVSQKSFVPHSSVQEWDKTFLDIYTDNVLLRLDTGKSSGEPPCAVGLTFVSFARIMVAHKDRPLLIPLVNLRCLPEDLWQAVLAIVTTPPVSDFLSVGLTLSLQNPPLPELVAV